MKSHGARTRPPRSWCRTWLGHRKLWLALGGCGLLLLVACVTTNQTLVVPSQIPGATFIGSEECAVCHGDMTAGFTAGADHAHLVVRTPNEKNIGCEACHGPGSVHSEAAGAARTIVNPGKSPEICFQCHLDKRGQFLGMPSHHPVLEGKIGCGDCHNPHASSLVRRGGASLDHLDSLCFDCHAAQRGPYVFEHEAMREGCASCHEPHGTVNARMLKQRDANLCLKCHMQQRTATGVIIGGYDHGANLARGTCWTAGCHEAVHGSQVSRSLRF
jgi:predicted CXXCH cytochrome family protein